MVGVRGISSHSLSQSPLFVAKRLRWEAAGEAHFCEALRMPAHDEAGGQQEGRRSVTEAGL